MLKCFRMKHVFKKKKKKKNVFQENLTDLCPQPLQEPGV